MSVEEMGLIEEIESFLEADMVKRDSHERAHPPIASTADNLHVSID